MFKLLWKPWARILKTWKQNLVFGNFALNFVGKSSGITKKYFLNWIFVAELPYYIKTLKEKVNNDVFAEHWAIPWLLLCYDPYKNYPYRNSVEIFLKDHCSFWFLVLYLQHFLAGEIIWSYKIVSYNTEWKMKNILRISLNFRLISRTIRWLKEQQNMRNEWNIYHYCWWPLRKSWSS